MGDYTAEDRRVRARLERNSSAGQRVDVVGRLNTVAAGDASRQLPGLAAYQLLKAVQARGRDISRLHEKHDRMLATGRLDDGEGERLDRIHPGPRAAAEGPNRIDYRQILERQILSRYF